MAIAWGQITISSILSLFLELFIGHRLALGRDRKKEIVEVGKVFRESFIELQRLLLLRNAKQPGGNEFKTHGS